MRRIAKRLGFFLIIYFGFAIDISANAQPQSREKGDVLLIYDMPELAAFTENILTAYNRTVDKSDVRQYTKEQLAGYQYVVLLTPIPLKDISPETKLLCIGEGFAIPEVTVMKYYDAGIEISDKNFYHYTNYIDEISVITEFQGESFGKIEMSFGREYPFGIKNGNHYYVPYVSEESISALVLGEMLPDFFDSSYQGGIYVIIQDMFAFSDLDMLCKTADELYLANIPFIVKVMPLYEHTTLDAFKRYVQVLRYVESRNGAIVMTPPMVNGEAEEEEIAEMERMAVQALTQEGVKVLPSVEGFYDVDMEYLREIKSSAKRYESFSVDVGILEELPQSDLQMKQMVANLNGRWYEFGNYRERFGLESKLFLEVPLDREIALREEEENIPLFFAVGNHILFMIVSVFLLFIGLLIYVSRVKYKRKFRKKGGII